MDKRPSVKILVAYHKPDMLFKDDMLTPINVGRALRDTAHPDEDTRWLLDNMTGDDTGDNISAKNRSYNEMTALYWAWKNYGKLGSPDYIGLMHYRRHFMVNDTGKAIYEFADTTENYLDVIGCRREKIEPLLAKYDFISVRPQYRESVYEHFAQNHRIEELDTCVDIINELYPDYSRCAEKYLHGHNAYFCNMFIMPRDMFFRYAGWIFGIMEEYERRMGGETGRMFISERLTGIFITKMLEEGKTCKELGTVFLNSPVEIPVVMATDDNYAMPTCTAIYSMLRSAKPWTTYRFHLLVPGDFSDGAKNKLGSMAEKFSNFSIEYIDMGNAFDDAEMQIEHISKATYYRLLLARLLPGLDKVIYLDSDIIVEQDLAEYWRTDVSDFYLAGVRVPGVNIWEKDKQQAHCDIVGIPELSRYVNAGALLMNLRRIREDGLTERFLELAGKNYPMQDQDILNKVCYGSIKILPFKYNTMIARVYQYPDTIGTVFSKSELEAAIHNPVIIHFLDKVKPWQDYSAIWAERWLRCALETPYAPLISESLGNEDSNPLKRAQELSKQNARLERLVRNLRAENSDAVNSTSYKIGMLITYIPRKIKRAAHCAGDNGWGYTIKRGIKKLLGRCDD